MKSQRLIIAVILILGISLAYGVTTNQSALFADSFLMRAYGAEAVYWNPSVLSAEYNDILLPGINQSFYITNNSLDLDTYNFISGRYLSENDKVKILGKIHNRLMVSGESHTTVFGIAFDRLAFASSTHLVSQARISKQYLDLILNGNTQDDYSFSKAQNQVNGIAYQDFTVGIGNVNLNEAAASVMDLPPVFDKVPTIMFGASGSILTGYGVVDTKSYHGSFHTGLDGMSLDQELVLRTATGGLGAKALMSLTAKPVENLSVGLSLDNIFGGIHWLGNTENQTYLVQADSVYASELDDDLITQQDSTQDISSFYTAFPLELRLGALYTMEQVTVSMDWVQGFRNSQVTSCIGRLSMGAEYLPIPCLPITMGLALGNEDYPWRMSYGIGYKSKYLQGGIGIQSIKSVLPGYYSKGISFTSYLTIPY
jgi:hypothetical protein